MHLTASRLTCTVAMAGLHLFVGIGDGLDELPEELLCARLVHGAMQLQVLRQLVAPHVLHHDYQVPLRGEHLHLLHRWLPVNGAVQAGGRAEQSR